MNKKYIIIIILFTIIILGVIILNILNKNNVNNENSILKDEYYIKDNGIYEKIDNINENAINTNISKINEICNKYLKDMNIYFTLIPNKEYYLDEQNRQQFNQVENIIINELNNNIKYFTIKETLELDDYYRTDIHWKQECLQNTIEKFQQELNINSENSNNKYEEKSLGNFYGQYYRKINDNNIKPDELKYLSNEVLENCTVYNLENKKEEKIYNLDKVNETKNKYDLFLSGATSISIVKNKEIDNNKKLILFRDSFGSSITPMLVENYEEIILIDIRYVNYTILENYINFEKYKNADVLFLYNNRVINKSGIFK